MNLLGLTEQFSAYIIRPTRSSYKIGELGQTTFSFKNVSYTRIDFTVPITQFNKILKIEASLYCPSILQSDPRPTLVYLHGNSSSRVSGKNYLKNVIQHFDVLCFDFRGCGKSDGKYITLGYLQKDDLHTVIQYVDMHYGNRKYFLWGRSMGAVTAILYVYKYSRDKNSDKIIALVLDSPFSSLQKVIQFIGKQKFPLLPSFMLESMIESLQEDVMQKIYDQYTKKFEIRKHRPIEIISEVKIPKFFIFSKSDQLIDQNEIKQMYNKASPPKQMEILQGKHNQSRPQHLKVAVVEFLLASLNKTLKGKKRKNIFDFASQGRSLNLRGEKKYTIINNNSFFDQPEQDDSKKRLYRISTYQQGILFTKSPNHISEIEEVPSPDIWNEGLNVQNVEEEQRLKEQVTMSHVQILDKVLPKESTRRTNRIFSYFNKQQK